MPQWRERAAAALLRGAGPLPAAGPPTRVVRAVPPCCEGDGDALRPRVLGHLRGRRAERDDRVGGLTRARDAFGSPLDASERAAA